AIGRGPEVREGDAPAVRAEGDWGREGVRLVQIDRRLAEGWPEPKALITARRAEATASAAVRADQEEPVVLRWERAEREERCRVVHLVHDRRSVRAHAQPLQRKSQHRIAAKPANFAQLGVAPLWAESERIRDARGIERRHRDRLPVASPDAQFLMRDVRV